MKKKWCAFLVVIVMLCAAAGCSDNGVNSGAANTGTTNGLDIQALEKIAPEADTPEAQLSGLAVGTSIWTNNMKITLNSIEAGASASDGAEAYKINVSYENHSDGMISVSPFDWNTEEADGSIVGYDMEGKGSFNLVTLPEGKSFSGNVILFKTANSKNVFFKPTLKWSNITAAWRTDEGK